MTRRWRLLALALSSLVLGGLAFTLWFWSAEPPPPANYQWVQLGMTSQRVDELLGPSSPFPGGTTGWQRDAEESPELQNRRLSSYHRTWWVRDPWAIMVTFDPQDRVAGKSLMLIDPADGSFLRNPRLWLKRRTGL